MGNGDTGMGPISYLVVEFPGSKMTGEGFPALARSGGPGVIRVLDLMFMTRDLDGRPGSSTSPTSTAMAPSTSRCSRGPRRGFSTRAISWKRARVDRAGFVGRCAALRESMGHPVRLRPATRQRPVDRGRLRADRRLQATLDVNRGLNDPWARRGRSSTRLLARRRIEGDDRLDRRGRCAYRPTRSYGPRRVPDHRRA